MNNEERILGILAELKQGQDETNRRMDKLDGHMDKLDGRMDKLDGRMDKLDGRVSNLESDMSCIKDTIERVDLNIKGIYGHLICNSRLVILSTRWKAVAGLQRGIQV